MKEKIFNLLVAKEYELFYQLYKSQGGFDLDSFKDYVKKLNKRNQMKTQV